MEIIENIVKGNSGNKKAALFSALKFIAKKYDDIKIFNIPSRSWKKEIRQRGLINFFKSLLSLEDSIDQLELFEIKKTSIISPFMDELIEKFNFYNNQLTDDNIQVVCIDDFKKYKLLENFKHDNVFLYIRSSDIHSYLNYPSAISTVGSRETPEKYSEWIKSILSKPTKSEFVVVSGLANGADLISHREAIKLNKKIVVFTGYPINYIPPKHKMDVFNYAINNGAVISSIAPWETFVPGLLQHRNKEMAWMSSVCFVLYINGKSGTNGHIKEMISLNKKIFMPKDVYDSNIEFMQENIDIFQNLEKVKVY